MGLIARAECDVCLFLPRKTDPGWHREGEGRFGEKRREKQPCPKARTVCTDTAGRSRWLSCAAMRSIDLNKTKENRKVAFEVLILTVDVV